MRKDSTSKRFQGLTDQDLVSRILSVPPDVEAAAYLLNQKYMPLLRKNYLKVFDGNNDWWEDCSQDFFIFMCGKSGDWRKFNTFHWECSIGTWLGKIAFNFFLEEKKRLIDSRVILAEAPTDLIPTERHNGAAWQTHSQEEQRLLLLEAISLLPDPNQRFVILQRLEGYDSREIAEQMKDVWRENGIVRFDSMGNKVVPSAAYVNVLAQRAKKNLKKIIQHLS
ncbi:MAG: RNA polymerase sigma factor [Alloprevotella sp.]